MGGRLGWGELVVILIIALIVLGPDKLPQMGRALGKAVRGVKKYVREAAQELEDFDELKDIKNDVDGIQRDLRSMGRSLEKSVTHDLEAVEEDVESAADDIRSAVEEEPEGEAETPPAAEAPASDAGNDTQEITAPEAESEDLQEET